MVGSASAKSNEEYNKALSKRRIDSIIKYFENEGFSQFIQDKKFIINSESVGENTTIPQKGIEATTGTTTAETLNFGTEKETMEPIDCNTNIKDKDGNVTEISEIYSVSAMACRRVRISNINCEAKPILVNEEKEEPKKEAKEEKEAKKEHEKKKSWKSFFSKIITIESDKETVQAQQPKQEEEQVKNQLAIFGALDYAKEETRTNTLPPQPVQQPDMDFSDLFSKEEVLEAKDSSKSEETANKIIDELLGK